MKKTRTPSLFCGYCNNRWLAKKSLLELAFTLIELLVVISIIAVVVGLMFPAVRGVRNAARNATAKNDVVQLANAIKSFYVEYGHYPDTFGGSETTGSNNKELIRCLTGSNVGGNTRMIRYLEVSNTSARNRTGLNESGEWIDPWQQSYIAFADTDYNGQIQISGLAGYTGETTVRITAGAASKGLSGSNPIVSWQ